LDPEEIKIVSLETTWNSGKGTGLSWNCIRLWGQRASLTATEVYLYYRAGVYFVTPYSFTPLKCSSL